MGKITVTECPIAGMYVIEPAVYGDERGYFFESYNLEDMKAAGLGMAFVQDNQSMSRRGVLRGLHFQKEYPQGKLVRVLRGEVFDVGVDLRKDSGTFGKWCGVRLSGGNRKQLYLPPGMAHGYFTLSDEAEFFYKCTEFYHPEDEGGIRWDDPELGVIWPIADGVLPIVSNKDQKHPGFREVFGQDRT